MKSFGIFPKPVGGPFAIEHAVTRVPVIVVFLGAIAAIGTGADSTFTTVQGKLTGTGS